MRRRSTLAIAIAIFTLLCSPLYASVGVPEPPGLPAAWNAGWCPQNKPKVLIGENGEQITWAGNPDAIAAGFNWQTHCPPNGWKGWYAELFPCTEAAMCLAWETNLFGTKALHNGNFRREDGGIKCNYSLRDFHIAEVFWDKSHAAYQLVYALGDEYPCKPSSGLVERPPIPIGTRVQRLSNGQWIDDTVKSAGRQIVEFTSGVRMTVGDEDRKWRRVIGSEPVPAPDPDPSPAPEPLRPPVITPPPTPPPASQICPAGQACREPCPVCEVCVDCLPAIILPPECAPIAAVRESAEVIARNVFTAQRRRQRVADCMKAIERTFAIQ